MIERIDLDETSVTGLDPLVRHHADHFFQGIQDAGWDLAAAAFEFDMDAACRERLVSRYAALSGDRDIMRRLPFYDVLAQPAPHLHRVSRREDRDVEVLFDERLEKRGGAGARSVPVVRIAPAGVAVEHSVQVDAHERTLGVLEIHFARLRWHRNSRYDFGPSSHRRLMRCFGAATYEYQY